MKVHTHPTTHPPDPTGEETEDKSNFQKFFFSTFLAPRSSSSSSFANGEEGKKVLSFFFFTFPRREHSERPNR